MIFAKLLIDFIIKTSYKLNQKGYVKPFQILDGTHETDAVKLSDANKRFQKIQMHIF